jgi:hypothetical protein
MRQILLDCDSLVGPFVAARSGAQYIPAAAKCIGLVEDGKVIAGVMYEAYNGANVSMHVAGEGRRWLTRDFLWICFDYPFNQLGVKRVTGVVPSSNADARRFDEHLGFVYEATLKDAYPGGDLIIYSMHRDQCRWLNLRMPSYVTRKQSLVQPAARHALPHNGRAADARADLAPAAHSSSSRKSGLAHASSAEPRAAG